MSERSEAAAHDVVDLLLRQHAEIRQLFDQVEAAAGHERTAAFERLRRLLAVHETAEEEVVHPYARRHIEGGREVVDARLAEENQAKQLLSDLDYFGPTSPDFLQRLGDLRLSVMDHARHEEEAEFPQLREHASEHDLRRMATAVKAAEAVAPTHPHVGFESATANLVAGPFAAAADRARDAIRKALSRQKD
ncbi:MULTISPECIES: hemerythrin domain-containing protein [unclassified Actinomadura]|uniref:hemerythrin domain-containing protein n=1 Tax=unclassified Actinomadura TaxID=2626254 RepID=UPI0011EDC613|nr:hemerythrin domain-containing protein [Actinomadura sp. K4S16]